MCRLEPNCYSFCGLLLTVAVKRTKTHSFSAPNHPRFLTFSCLSPQAVQAKAIAQDMSVHIIGILLMMSGRDVSFVRLSERKSVFSLEKKKSFPCGKGQGERNARMRRREGVVEEHRREQRCGSGRHEPDGLTLGTAGESGEAATARHGRLWGKKLQSISLLCIYALLSGGCSGARSCSAAPRAHCSRDDTDGSVVPASDIAGNSQARGGPQCREITGSVRAPNVCARVCACSPPAASAAAHDSAR